MTLPTKTDLHQGAEGGHEVLVIGYNKTHLTILNSWGENWGKNGKFYMPIAYLTSTYQNQPLVSQIIQFASIPTPNQPPSLAANQVIAGQLQSIISELNNVTEKLQIMPTSITPAQLSTSLSKISTEISSVQSLVPKTETF